MKRLNLRRFYAIAFSAAGAAVAGCGVLTAPVSLPGAVAQNANYNFNFTPVDPQGNPLTGVLMAEELNHHFWTPVAGGTDTDEHHLKRVDGNYTVSERGEELQLHFSHDGFRDVNVTFTAARPNVVTTNDTEWPNVKSFPLVMYPDKPSKNTMSTSASVVPFDNYPNQWAVYLPNVGAVVAPTWSQQNVATDADRFQPGMFYFTLIKGPPPVMNSKGDVDPNLVNVPESVTLHIAGPDAGFVRIAPRIGYLPIQTADTAPKGGYLADVTIDRTRLAQMRAAGPSAVIEGNEYFFVHAGGYYGKARMSWQGGYTPNTPGQKSFAFQFWMQRSANNTDVSSPDAVTK